jgi:hypothetical protein
MKIILPAFLILHQLTLSQFHQHTEIICHIKYTGISSGRWFTPEHKNGDEISSAFQRWRALFLSMSMDFPVTNLFDEIGFLLERG